MSALAFEVPPVQPARERDHVRMLVASRAGISHRRFLDLPDLLEPGDLLVVNTSATLPAALEGSPRVHLSTPLPGEWPEDGHERWVIELRDGDARHRGGRAGQRIVLPGGGEAELLAPYLGADRLWAARLTLPAPLLEYLGRHGEPIRYRHQTVPRPLADYQTIFASEPGSAEMPSAARPFSERVVEALEDRGIEIATIVLHAGVSSLERGERPYPERFRVPAGTLAAVRAARRVIAVGTTVVRALETAADGVTEGWTRLVVEPDRGGSPGVRSPSGYVPGGHTRGVSVVDGILTGWHEPDASHLLMLEAIAGRRLVERSYAAALADGYRWHEFGDSHLLLA